MSYNRIQYLCCLRLFQMIIRERFFQRTTDKSIFSISNSRFTILIHCLLNTLRHLVADMENFIRIRQCAYNTLNVRIILQQFNGEETGRIFMPDKLVLGHFTFYSLNRFFYIRTVIYMNMPEDTPRLFMFTHIIFQMLFLMVLTVFQRVMPFSQVFENFRIHVSLFIEEVYSFIQIDNYMKQRIQSTIFLTGSRQHRHPEQLAQQMVIQCISTGFQFIIDIQSHYHADIHVYQLSSQI